MRLRLQRLPRYWHRIANAVGTFAVVAWADVERELDREDTEPTRDARRVAPVEPLARLRQKWTEQANRDRLDADHRDDCMGSVLLAQAAARSACALDLEEYIDALGEAQRIPAPPDAPQE